MIRCVTLFIFLLISILIQAAEIRGRDLQGIEYHSGFFGLEAPVQQMFANQGDCRLDGDGVIEEGQVELNLRDDPEVTDLFRRRAAVQVVVAELLTAKSGRAAGLAVERYLLAGFVGISIGI